MADEAIKISALTELEESPEINDIFLIVDVDDNVESETGKTKKITFENLVSSITPGPDPNKADLVDGVVPVSQSSRSLGAENNVGNPSSVAFGMFNAIISDYAMVAGAFGEAKLRGEKVFSTNKFIITGDSQTSFLNLMLSSNISNEAFINMSLGNIPAEYIPLAIGEAHSGKIFLSLQHDTGRITKTIDYSAFKKLDGTIKISSVLIISDFEGIDINISILSVGNLSYTLALQSTGATLTNVKAHATLILSSVK